MHTERRGDCKRPGVAGWLILVGVALAAICAQAGASQLTRGKKALFGEDFEMDIYEWTLMEEGENKGEDPDLVRTREAFEGNNALVFSGTKGIRGLQMTEKIKGLVEFQVKFPAPHNYTRMFAVGLDDKELLMGINRSGNFAYAVEGIWHTSKIPVDENWHTFTYDFSGAVARVYIDGQLIASARQPRQFDRVRLGVNNGRGGRCLVDKVVIYGADIQLSEENAIEVTVPLIDWDGGLKPASSTSDNRYWPTATYSVTEEKYRSGRRAASITYEPAEEGVTE